MARKTTSKQAKKQPNVFNRFFRETTGELRKVSWPSRQEAISLTKVVVWVVVIMAIFLGGLDFLFFELFNFIFSL